MGKFKGIFGAFNRPVVAKTFTSTWSSFPGSFAMPTFPEIICKINENKHGHAIVIGKQHDMHTQIHDIVHVLY